MTTIKEKIREAVNDLIQTGKISEPNILSGFDPHVMDLYPILEPYFSDQAKKVLNLKSKSIIYQWKEPACDRKLTSQDQLFYLLSKLGIRATLSYTPIGVWDIKSAPVYCFGLSCDDPNDVFNMSLKLVEIINDIVKSGFIKATLMPISLFRFSAHPFNPGINRYAVVSYLNIPYDLDKDVKAAYGQYMFDDSQTIPEYK
jgi:hypothetical protein